MYSNHPYFQTYRQPTPSHSFTFNNLASQSRVSSTHSSIINNNMFPLHYQNHSSSPNVYLNPYVAKMSTPYPQNIPFSTTPTTPTNPMQIPSLSSLQTYYQNKQPLIKHHPSPYFQQRSEYETRLLNAQSPLAPSPTTNKLEIVKLNLDGNHGTIKGQWTNSNECDEWQQKNGEHNLAHYKLNTNFNSSNVELIVKQLKNNSTITTSNPKHDLIQKCEIRYLRPSTPPPPGDIIIRQEGSTNPPPPPLIIRQRPTETQAKTPEPLIIREQPPIPPTPLPTKVITIKGKQLPPQPRRVIIERLPPMPPKPPALIIERWLPYEPIKRKVIYQQQDSNNKVQESIKNVIVEWETPQVKIENQVKYMGVFTANPLEYKKKFEHELMHASQMPSIVNDIKTPEGLVLAADAQTSEHEIEFDGDVEALSLLKDLSQDEMKIVSIKDDDDDEESLCLSNGDSEMLARAVFQVLDVSKRGYIRLEDACCVFEKLNGKFNRNYTKEDAQLFFSIFDSNEKRMVTFDEFRRDFTKTFF